MRPRIICHMLASVDGRIDGASLKEVTASGEYEATGAQLRGDAWVCGRRTMELHFAEEGSFVSRTKRPAGPRDVYVARRAASYAVSMDTLGKLRWSGPDIDGDHLICVVSERVPEDYLSLLEKEGISYVVAGDASIDLALAVRLLGERFGIRTLLLEGGGQINGSFLQAGLVDEVSLLLVPAIDGRHDIPAVFDGVSAASKAAVALELTSVDQRGNGTLWIRYKVREKRTEIPK